MGIVFERPDEVTIIVKCEYSAEEVSRKFDNLVNKYSRQVNIPGFRPGKAPKSLVLTRFGEAFRNDLTQELLSEAVKQAIEEAPQLEKALFTDEPKFNEVVEGEPFSVEIYSEIAPEVELVKTAGFEIERVVLPIEDAEIDNAIEDILMRNSSLQKRQRAALDTDYIEIQFSAGDEDSIPMLIPLDDPEYARYFDELIGKSIGDTVEIVQEFPDSFPDRRLQGKKGSFHIEVTNVNEQVKPELNAEFLKNMGKPENYTVDDFRKEVAELIRQEKTKDSEDLIKQKFVEALVDTNPVKIPPKYFDIRLERFIKENWDTTKISEEELGKLKEDIIPQLERGIAYEFISDQIIKIENLEVSEQELLDHAKSIMISMGYGPKVADDLYKPGSDEYARLEKQFLRNKALDSVMAKSTIIDALASSESENRNDSEQNAVEE